MNVPRYRVDKPTPEHPWWVLIDSVTGVTLSTIAASVQRAESAIHQQRLSMETWGSL